MVETAHLIAGMSTVSGDAVHSPKIMTKSIMQEKSALDYENGLAAHVLTQLCHQNPWPYETLHPDGEEACSLSWTSQSPISSESTESCGSASFHSPLGPTNSKSNLELHGSKAVELIDPMDDLTENQVDFLDEYVELAENSLFSHFSSSTSDELNCDGHTTPKISVPNTSHSKEVTTRTFPKRDHIYRLLSTEDNESSTPIRQHISTTDRPATLNLDKRSRVLISPELNTNSAVSVGTFRLEEQLASADNAWFGALDLPSLCLEDIDLLLTTTNCLQSPNGTLQQTLTPSPSNSLTMSDLFTAATSILPHYTGESTMNFENPGSQKKSLDLDAEEEQNTHGQDSDNIIEDNAEEAVESDATVTCSEAEYHKQQLELKERRKRHRARRRFDHRVIWATQMESDDSDDDDEEEVLPSKQRKFGKQYRYGNKTLTGRKTHSVQADAELKAWWPKKATDCLTTRNSQSSFRFGLNASRSSHCSSDDSGHESDNTGSLSQPRTCHRTAYRRDEEQRHVRKRKQMELWQFVLWRLETARNSAFQWVNRATGVFRIVDTQSAAREWGRYRNNSRMDYEKMARAMRFYYKDSILRKAHQQLHFQFAKPCVEWAEKVYHKR